MQTLKQYVESNYQKSLGECSKEEVYVALLHYTKEKSILHFCRIFNW